MTFQEYRKDHFRRLQKQILTISAFCSILAFIMELIIFYLNHKLGYIEGTELNYFFVRILIPSGINFCVTGFCAYVYFSKNSSEKLRNNTASFTILTCCTVVACAHCYYTFLLFCLMLPMFLCTIFADKKITKSIITASVLCTCLACVIYFFEYSEVPMDHRIVSIICLWLLFLVSSHIAVALVHSQIKQISFISENYDEQLKLIEELKIEPMTGLYNKACLETCFKTYTDKYHKGIFNPTCCIIDIDHFKSVNDTYGHMEGDKVLKNLALIIKTDMGGIRRAFRFGGEEFVILWENENPEEVFKKVCEIKEDFCASEYDFAPGQHFSFSAGICKLDDSMTSDTWFKNADETLYKAKTDGRDRIYVYSEIKNLS